MPSRSASLLSSLGPDVDTEADDELIVATLVVKDTITDTISSISIPADEEVKIGRDEDMCCNGYTLDDQTVSKQHFRIYSITYDEPGDPAPGGLPPPAPMVYCEDLESSNGTYVNDFLIGIRGKERIGHLLSHGDVIEIRPHWKFRFCQPSIDPESTDLRDKSQLSEQQSLESLYFEGLYTIANRPLGSGQSAVVYLATELRTKKQLACKVVDLSEATQEPAQNAKLMRQRALREINILRRLNHPNIVELKKAFVFESSTVYMFLELAAGGDLFSYIQSEGGMLKDYQSRVITRQVTIAIQFIHSQRIAHRDIKPENILITRKGIGLRVVLTDFGHAKALDENKIDRRLSDVGTRGYAAPEASMLKQSRPEYLMARDMWSLGIVTLCTLTGQLDLPPMLELSDMSPEEIEEQIPHEDDRYAQELWQILYPAARNFLRGLLNSDTNQRMNAEQALAHPWYTRPRGQPPHEVENLYERSIKFWKSRGMEEDEVVEYIGHGIALPPPTETGPKRRKRLPDTTLSPYFSLHRHIQPRSPSNRQHILAQLNRSGNYFLGLDEVQPMVPCTRREIFTTKISSQLGRSTVRARSVQGIDIFGSSEIKTASSQDFRSDDHALVSTSPVLQAEQNVDCSVREGIDSAKLSDQSAVVVEDFDYINSPANKRQRTESWDLEDKRIRELAYTKVPLFCTAKIYKDAITMGRNRGTEDSH